MKLSIHRVCVVFINVVHDDNDDDDSTVWLGRSALIIK